MTKAIYVLNGPNLNRLGKREPEIYGTTTLAEIETMCRKAADGHPLQFRQSNAEHELIDWIHEAIDRGAGIVINAAGLTFRSIPILDALKMFPGPIFQLHITNVHRREPFREHSYLSDVADGVIVGCGTQGYALAIARIAHLARREATASEQ